jgi:hypothetical protein
MSYQWFKKDMTLRALTLGAKRMHNKRRNHACAKSRHTSAHFPPKSLCLNVLTFPSMMLRMEGFCGLPAQFTSNVGVDGSQHCGVYRRQA